MRFTVDFRRCCPLGIAIGPRAVTGSMAPYMHATRPAPAKLPASSSIRGAGSRKCRH